MGLIKYDRSGIATVANWVPMLIYLDTSIDPPEVCLTDKANNLMFASIMFLRMCVCVCVRNRTKKKKSLSQS